MTLLDAPSRLFCGKTNFHKVFKYELTIVVVAMHYKVAKQISLKESAEVGKAFQKICKRGPLHWPQLLQVGSGKELMGNVTKESEKPPS